MLSIVNAARDINRLREIYVVLVRHGFGEIVSRLRLARPPKAPKDREQRDSTLPPPSERGDSMPPPGEPDFIPADVVTRGEEERTRISLAERIRLVAQDLGPSFIKLGQLLSTRTDIIPADILTELKKLQDDVPPEPFEKLRPQIEKCLGAPLEEVFDYVDEKPLAAASIGQVHRALLKIETGAIPVAIKVQRPGVEQIVMRDLDLLHLLAALIERAIPESRIYSPRGLVDQFDRAITSELDFRAWRRRTRDALRATTRPTLPSCSRTSTSRPRASTCSRSSSWTVARSTTRSRWGSTERRWRARRWAS